ncbi:ArsR/SmtB family transcription factor [Caulobacter sp. KR2-114]|uniref:ArsR/SmtB family transcription factor n=1 Tax=Caulobacter sp. KR2-114 TaxID=3400912 RepID=UPI003C0550BD
MSIAVTFEALGDANRRQIMAYLAAGEAPVGEIADQFNVSLAAISQHLKVLRDAGLVTVRSRAQQRLYAIASPALAEAAGWLIGLAERAVAAQMADS